MNVAEEHAMTRTIIVSNRLPFGVVRDAEDGVPHLSRSGGGLVSAMLPVHQQTGSLWLGYAGAATLDADMAACYARENLVPLTLPDALYDLFYNGAANGALWPLFHYFPALAVFDPAQWQAYVAVNERFAEAVAAQITSDDDVVWIHDYLLMLLPGLLRARRPDVRIGYFHHIPFPAADVFKLHPAREELLNGVLGADFVGFHTLEYARHFITACERQLGLEPQVDELSHGDRTVRIGALPLGIDLDALHAALASPAHAHFATGLQSAWAGQRVLLGVERLDYTKGIRERLLAFAELLRRRPDLRGQVTFVQVCVPSRENVERYAALRRDIEQLIGHINGEFGTATHVPVHYLHRSLAWPELTALYRRADVCMVTPLRDGLNLVCKEFVAAREDLGGMLILSEFAGAAEEMGEALLVNPYDVDGMATAMATALDMDPNERRQRMGTLLERVRNFDNRAWSRAFLQNVAEVAAINREHATRELDDDEVRLLADNLHQANGILLALDHDAMVDDGLGHGRRTRWTPDRLRQELAPLLQSTRITIALLVGTDRTSSDRTAAALNDLPIWMGDSHGPGLRPPGGAWSHPVDRDGFAPFHAHILAILRRCEERVPRSRLIDTDERLAWDFRHVPGPIARGIARETAHAINQILAKSRFSCALGRRGLEIRPCIGGQGIALDRLAQACGRSPTDAIISIGDRFSDDALFTWGGACNHGIAIGTPATRARYLIPDLARLSAILPRLLL
jgi:trehalose 6-phosphate synthase/phosphatase